MKKVITLIFLSTIYSFEISSIVFTYGLPNGEKGTLSQEQYDANCSANLNFKMTIGDNSSINYFIEYNRFELNLFEAEYEMYLLGVGYQRNYKIFNTDKLMFNSGISFGLSDDQFTNESSELFGGNTFTYDDIYMFLRFDIGSTYIINDKLSMIFKYNYTFTNEQYGYTDLLGYDYDAYYGQFEDAENIQYSSLLLGLSFNLK